MDKIKEHQVALTAVAGAAVTVGAAYYIFKARDRTPKSGPYPADSLPADAYDAVIVGAGPSGSTAGYYLARAGAKVRGCDTVLHFCTSGDAPRTPGAPMHCRLARFPSIKSERATREHSWPSSPFDRWDCTHIFTLRCSRKLF